jgi:hypothetical protein
MRLFPSFRGRISPARYALAATGLVLSQYALVAVIHSVSGVPISHDAQSWLLPLRALAQLPGLSPLVAALGFAFWLIVAWVLAALSFRRASRAGYGYLLAILAVVPGIQIGAIFLLAILPGQSDALVEERPIGMNAAHVLQGALAGMSIIVLAVLISAVTFGAYGWGLFLMTPFLAGLTTAYLANRDVALPHGRTTLLVMASAALGTLALIMCALEGLVCVLLASPLGAAVAAMGGTFGRALATIGHKRGKPLLSIALLPALFALEATAPPALPIDLSDSIEIDAPPSAVWKAVTADDAIGPPAWAIAEAGFAYPTRGRLLGRGVGAGRIGEFSTGIARERVTEWAPSRRLSFTLLTQPPMMEEMSPYRRVHAPHVQGYFTTTRTSFELQPLGRNRTRLTIADSHILRLDPALYWEPLARWAIAQNVSRVLQSIKRHAEASAS